MGVGGRFESINITSFLVHYFRPFCFAQTNSMAESIGFIGHRSPPIGTLFGPENIIWDLKPVTEAQCLTRISLAGLRSQIMFSGPNKGVIGGFGRPMNPMDSAIWSVELEIAIEASIDFLSNFVTFYHF